MRSGLLAVLQKLGKALMAPVAVLPAAGLLLRLGQPDLLNIPWIANAGGAVFDNLPLIFAIGIGVGLAEENNGIAGLAAAVGYLVVTKVAVTFNKTINMGVLAGIVSGVAAGVLYNRYHDIKVPAFLGFFGGRRFVPIVTSLTMLVVGVAAGLIWPVIQHAIEAGGDAVANSGWTGSFVFGFANRLLIPFGLHHILNTLFWFQIGSFTTEAGVVVHGDLTRFFAGDPAAGNFMAGFFPVMMFALPAACLAMITAARPGRRREVSGMLLSIALTSFLTGITEPVEFTFMFLAPALYLAHALLTGLSLAVCTLLGIKDGFGFSAGLFDYLLNFGKATKPALLLVVGLVWAVVYYLLFLAVIRKFNLPTPGRYEERAEKEKPAGEKAGGLADRAALYLEAIGGPDNIQTIDACITRLRLVLHDAGKVDDRRVRELGASGVIRLNKNNVQIVVGTVADALAGEIKNISRR
ncbi:MAG: N-acetylglucosamine-specific PTS transporter subunit IIBC [Negativicutes bacterium]|nr:N-acetylglucosamine-specific PTS transporter subunit IIBC [Negativicutes bacterium]